MSPERYSEGILKHMAEADYRPQKLRQLARAMGIAEAEYGDFRDAIKALRQTGRVVLGGRNALMLPEPAREIIGHFRANPRGFGFVIPESAASHGDLFVPPGHTMGAITGDLVSARVLKKGKRDGRMIFEGRVTEIIQRGRSQFVGELCRDAGRSYVRPDGNILHVPIFIGDVGAKGARAGDQVVVEIIRYPSHEVDARGVILKVLGRSGDPETDTLSIIHQYQLPHEFDQEVLESARRAVTEHDVEQAVVGREDLREQTVITIDPDDARDFDDAISISTKGDGRLELGVHIADVSLFVQPGTALDDEARQRGNSVYFPQDVIPMLPEVLSNGLCSLQQGQPRLTKSAFITYDKNGRVMATRFANSVIHSTRRLTYREASGALEGRTGGLSRPVVELLRNMESLARAIEKRRRADGMIELNLPEVELVFDKGGKVTGLQPVDVSYSHKIIEMFMIEANEAVARLFVSRNVPHLRRVHPAPEATADANLTKFLRAIGLSAPRLDDRQGVQGLLDSVRNKPQAFAVNLAVLRSMQRAEYAPKLIGHFALASNDYSHFTSPIRRYPDLTVHRLLDVFLAGGLESQACSDDVPTTEELEVLGAHCSHQERRAEAAERELHLIKVLRLLEDRVGDVLTGIVTGVTNFGIFVQLNEYLIEGLIRFEALGDDWWEVDTIRGCVIGQRSGKRYVIGQMIDAVIVGVDVGARQLDLAMKDFVAGRDAGVQRRRRVASRATAAQTPLKRAIGTSTSGKPHARSSAGKTVKRRRRREPPGSGV